MKKIFVSIAYMAAALCVLGCAKAVKVGPNDANKRYLEAWMEVNHPGTEPTGLGIYVLEETEGTGAEIEEGGYVIVDYTVTDLEGNISSYTSKETAKQLGKYDTTYYYGAKVWSTTAGTIQAGLGDALAGMKAGGRKKVVIPSWLMTYKTYDNVEDYLNPPKRKKDEDTSTGYSNAIYEFTVNDFVEDINDWEIVKIGEYLKAEPSLELNVTDSLKYGFYYRQLKAPTDTAAFGKDTTIYINYTGKLLNGLVFDTTDEKVAKDNGLYSASRSYEPVSITWGSEYTDLKMSGSTIISGFALTLWQMRAFEKGVGIFYSPLGYSNSGSGASIPGYAPLIFEIEVVEKPEE